jgi:DNA polymerase
LKLDDWPGIERAIEACHSCALAESCTRKVAGKGNREADLMIIGEARGHEEDLQGKPFVGRAGQLLDRMLEAIQIDPPEVYITNILKCRPPQNRDPRPEEVSACNAFLQAQIKQIKPRVILSVGRISAQNLLQDQSPVGHLRAASHTLPGSDIPLCVTYHPAYLLRNPAEKAKVWQDLKALRRKLDHADD